MGIASVDPTLYLPIVRIITKRLFVRLAGAVEFDDLYQDGCEALIHALKSYDPAKGTKIETWLYCVIPCRIFNLLRSRDSVPERIRRDARRLLAGEVMDEHQRARVHEYIALDNPLRLDAATTFGDDDRPIRYEPRANGPEPEVVAISTAMRAALRAAIDRLPERDKLIVLDHYENGTPFQHIGDGLARTKQRISQLHLRSLKRLRRSLEAWAS